MSANETYEAVIQEQEQKLTKNMQHPHRAEKRHLRLVTVGNFHLYFPKSGVRRRGEIEIGRAHV